MNLANRCPVKYVVRDLKYTLKRDNSPSPSFRSAWGVAEACQFNKLTITHAMSYHDIIARIRQKTKGKPYVFVVMDYKKETSFYRHIKQIVEEEYKLPCIRAKDIPAGPLNILEIVHPLIDRTELLVVLIRGTNPNVFYELGYAVARQKPHLLLVHEKVKIPANLQGKIVIRFGDTDSALDECDVQFRHHLDMHIRSGIGLLRDMLIAEKPQPVYIVASPKYPSERDRRILGQQFDRRTFGDNLGIVGLLKAFGTIMGEGMVVELISAKHSAPELIERDLNLYLIGSKKVNHVAGTLLARLQEGKELTWYLGNSNEGEVDNYIVRLYREVNGKQEELLGRTVARKNGIVHEEDYGLIVRAPHPEHPKRLVLIMAGPHSLGTGAACLAATRTPLIRDIRDKLPEGVLADKTKAFWVLVKGEIAEDGMLDEASVTIEQAGVYK